MSDFFKKNRASGGSISAKKKPGTLIGVGVGPGDPDLMTVRASRLISSADVIAYPALPGTASFARRIVGGLVPATCEEIVLEVPMERERAPAQAVYDKGSVTIAARLADGEDVIFLCEGDPLFFGSFMYLLRRLGEDFPVEIVPGVTSLTAVAACAKWPLAARNDRFAVLPAPLPDEALVAAIERADGVAIPKVGRHLPRIRAVLDGLGLLDKAIYVERATLPDEQVCKLASAPEDAPYFSMILVTKGADPWL